MGYQLVSYCFYLKTFSLLQFRLCLLILGLTWTGPKPGQWSMKLNASKILIWERFPLFLPSSSKKVRSQGSDLLLVLQDPMSVPHWHFKEVRFYCSFLLLFLTKIPWGRGSMLSKLSEESHKIYCKLGNSKRNGWNYNRTYNCKCEVCMGWHFWFSVLDESMPPNATLCIYKLSFCQCNLED